MSANILSKFGLLVVENFLDAKMCAELREEARATANSQATVTFSGMSKVDEYVRSTKIARVSAPAATLVKERLLEFKSRVQEHFKAELTNCSEPQFLIYREGDFFQPHRDNSHNQKDDDEIQARRISAVIFLNGEAKEPAPQSYGGGSLIFYELLRDERCRTMGFPVISSPGLLIAFPADLVHEVTPVRYGERFTVVSWYS